MAKVLTIGEAMGLLIADRPGDLAEVEQFSRHVCGAELNYAVGMARLGHDVSYISKVGGDPFGRSIRAFLKDNGIHTDYVQTDEAHMTGFQMKERVLEGDPAVANIRKYTAFSFMTPDDLQGICWDGVTHLHTTGIPLALSPSCRQTVVALMKEARRRGVSVSFDTNLRPMLWPDTETMAGVINDASQYADIVMPGLSEGKILTGLDDEQAVAGYYLERGAKLVVIKLGGSSGSYVCDDKSEFYVPSYHADNVVDTVGAGDGFAVGFTSAWLEGLSMEGAAQRGAAIGAMVIQVPGDNEGLPTREQLAAFQNEQAE
ncbi:sugar kinase [uncultured Megasphaera sp.]|uniref:sugar kinase n=1 Tax=uncultured Megasphaera sp. TaxID=165188 RepID=UPI00265CBD7E|nr:sugar kinase [uncultured Megasphaera sp.]